MKILLATNNHHKKIEFEALLPQVEILLPTDVGLKTWNHQEVEESFWGNSLGKASSLFRENSSGLPVLADDSGICVSALGGAPGVFSARFGEGELGRPLSDQEKNALLLKKMTGTTDRKASFVCCLTLIISPERFFSVQESWTGVIAEEPRGEHGFGYDPVFFLPDLGRVSAELDPEEKNRISHRGRAVRRVSVLLDDLFRNP
jgi:XTP/dITP diphosphohydrolase